MGEHRFVISMDGRNEIEEADEVRIVILYNIVQIDSRLAQDGANKWHSESRKRTYDTAGRLIETSAWSPTGATLMIA